VSYYNPILALGDERFFARCAAAGVSTLAPLADGIVVGSAIVARVAQEGTRATRAARVRRFVRSLRSSLG